jgi:hypothetical protein
LALGGLYDYSKKFDEITAALKKERPTTKEAADKIAAGIREATAAAGFFDDGDAEEEDADEEDDAEAAAIIAKGADPALPPPTPNPPPTNFALREFDHLISRLKELMTKPSAQFTATIHSVNDLENVEGFIHAVMQARKEKL